MNKIFYVFSETKSFTLINAFITEVGKLGILYNHNFSKLSEENYNNRYSHLYFSNQWDGKYVGNSCALSQGGGDDCFRLETNWREAINHVKEWIIVNNNNNKKVFELNTDYQAEIDYNTKMVKVGCQKFSFQKIQELNKLLENK